MATIKIQKRINYGTVMMYVVGEMAKAVATLTGKKTVDQNDIQALTSMGFQIEFEGGEISL